MIQRSNTKYLDTMFSIGDKWDIALLSMNDDKFMEEVTHAIWSSVIFVGCWYYCRLSTWQLLNFCDGVVSHIEVPSYVHGSTKLLGVLIDATINARNSSKPYFKA